MNWINSVALALVVGFVSSQSIESGKNELINDPTRIVNGSIASSGQFPHQVSLRRRGDYEHFCGASIIQVRWIITAAHCPDGIKAIDAVVGITKLNETGTVYEIQDIYTHPEFNGQLHMKHDISLLKTAKHIIFNAFVQPIALPNRNTTSYIPTTVSGWGQTEVSI